MVVTRLWDLSRGWAHRGRPALLAVSVFLLVAGSAVAQDGEASDGRLRGVGDGVLMDSRTGLEWTKTDNGSDIDWQGAMSYCGELGLAGGSWRLPSIEELEGLLDYDPAPFQLTGLRLWSSTKDGSSEAWLLNLAYGVRSSSLLGFSYGFRALCVRRSGG